MAKVLLRVVGEYQKLYRDSTNGIAWVEDGSTGCGHSCHANISVTGSIRGMKQQGYWGKKDRCVRSHGFIYNTDTYAVDSDLDKIAADACQCDACIERKKGTYINPNFII